MIVAIDGPSGAGKSTVAKAAAKRLSGGMDSTLVAVMAHDALGADHVHGVMLPGPYSSESSIDDAEALGAIARDNEIEFGHVEGDPVPRRVFISGAEVTDDIRTSEIDRAVGPVAAVPAVREALVAQQQRIGRAGDYVVEGRDIGTVVFPEAPVKVFLTASAEERATRRVKQNEERHVGSTNYEEVLADIRKRDEIDSSRAASPLKPAEDAVHLDSTGKTIEEIISFICSRAEQAQG